MNNNEILSAINQIPSKNQREQTLHRIAELKAVMEDMKEKAIDSDNGTKHRLHAAIQAINTKIDDIMKDVLTRYNITDSTDL